MTSLRTNQALVADDILLDGRLALVDKREGWLAVADLHFGFEISQRAAGRLVPFWGMASISERLRQLLEEYRPARLIILGDLVHDQSAAAEAAQLLEELGRHCETIVVAGNHDRRLRQRIPMVESWETGRFYFHHGHCAAGATDRIQIIGHHHPAGVLSDGAGLRLKCPAFVQQSNCWIMPAFSPWAGHTRWTAEEPARMWLCTEQRVFLLADRKAA